MAEWERFPNAPITEALVDIRAKLPSSVDLGRLAAFHDSIREHYPDRQERTSWQASVALAPTGASLQSVGRPDGFLFRSRDGRQIVQVRLDGFTFSRLRPYKDWERFRADARHLWEKYLELATPENVSRLALRYINRIELPLPFRDFREYILTAPEVAPTLPQGLVAFFMRLVVPADPPNAVAIITETIEEASESALPLIFDIDVYREGSYTPENPEVWEIIESLRDFKNRVFFDSLTPKAKELFR